MEMLLLLLWLSEPRCNPATLATENGQPCRWVADLRPATPPGDIVWVMGRFGLWHRGRHGWLCPTQGMRQPESRPPHLFVEETGNRGVCNYGRILIRVPAARAIE